MKLLINIQRKQSTLIVLSLDAVASQVASGCQSQANIGPLCAVKC